MRPVVFTAPNKLYGDKEIAGYGQDGLVVHKIGKSGWTISHQASGSQLSGKAVYKTKAAAAQRLALLLDLDVKWALPWDEMRPAFSANATDIRIILAPGGQ